MSITKGPWSGPVNNADRFEIQGEGRRIAVVDKIEDARLMKAAPDLLEALIQLEAFVAGFSLDETGWKKRDAARAAIARSES
jgi:hypothetical protein